MEEKAITSLAPVRRTSTESCSCTSDAPQDPSHVLHLVVASAAHPVGDGEQPDLVVVPDGAHRRAEGETDGSVARGGVTRVVLSWGLALALLAYGVTQTTLTAARLFTS